MSCRMQIDADLITVSTLSAESDANPRVRGSVNK